MTLNRYKQYSAGDKFVSASDMNRRGTDLVDLMSGTFDSTTPFDQFGSHRVTYGGPTRSAATAPSPWAATVSGTTLTLLPGTINSVVPSNIFAEFTITGSGIEFVVVTLSITSDSPNSALISIESTPPIPSLTTEGSVPAEAKDVVAIVNDGVVYQIRNTNIYAQSYEVFRNPVAAPVYGELNYVPWYRWEILES